MQHHASRGPTEASGKTRPFTIETLQWVYVTPSAFQVFAHFTSGLVIPGFLGSLASNWRALTHRFWSWFADRISIPFDDLGSVYDIFTLAIFILLSTLGAKLRRNENLLDDTKERFTQASFIGKRKISLGMSLLCMAYIIVFSMGSLVELFAGRPLLTAAILYPPAFVIVFIGIEYYFGFSRKAVESQIEMCRSKKSLGVGTLYLPVALSAYSLPLASAALISFFIVFAQNGLPMPYDSLELALLALIFTIIWALFLWLLHLKLNFPSSASLAENFDYIVRFILISAFLMGPLLPLAANASTHASEANKAWAGGLSFLGGFLLTLSFLFMLRTSWKVARNILLAFVILMVADQTLKWLLGLLF